MTLSRKDTKMHQAKNFARTALALLLAAGAAAANAQSSSWMDGRWMVSIGGAQIKPNVSSGALSAPSAPNTRIDVEADTQAVVSITRLIDDHWSIEVPIGAGFKHKIIGAGGIAGVGQIGSVRAVPVTVFGQYRFLSPNDRIRPYVMGGLTYAYFQHERGSAALSALNPLNPVGGSTGLSIDSKLALSAGLGVTAFFTDKYFFDAQWARTFLKTKATLSTGQTIDAKLNPDLLKVSIGMRF